MELQDYIALYHKGNMTEFANKANIDLSTVSRLCRGKNRPRDKTVKIIEAVTSGKVSWQDLLAPNTRD